jgi:hypothetical protein
MVEAHGARTRNDTGLPAMRLTSTLALISCAALAMVVAVQGCSDNGEPDAARSAAATPTEIEVRLGGSPAELVGADWPRLSDGRWQRMTAYDQLRRLVVRWDDRSLELPAKLVTINQVNERVESLTISPLAEPLPFLEALRFCEELLASNGATVMPDFVPKIEQWKRDVPKVEATVHTGGIRTYPTETRGLRATLPGGQEMHVEIRNYEDSGWIVGLNLNRSSE